MESAESTAATQAQSLIARKEKESGVHAVPIYSSNVIGQEAPCHWQVARSSSRLFARFFFINQSVEDDLSSKIRIKSYINTVKQINIPTNT